MHPAGSVILFTTFTGFGYGLLCWLGLSTLLAQHIPNWLIYACLGIAFILNVVGLSASTWHLGHPERAWRAMSQYRSSWLSREGISAVLSFMPMLLLAVATFYGWYSLQKTAGLLCIILSLLTVFTTAMIYASLKPIAAWHNVWTVIGYLAHALLCGGVLWWFINSLLLATAGLQGDSSYIIELFAYLSEMSASITLMLPIICIALINKILWIRKLNYGNSSIQSAIGLQGEIKQLDPPHSSANYLMKEMGYEIARRHATPLMAIAIIATYLIPLIGLFFASTAFFFGGILAICAIGIAAERYLFFAQAKHTVSLYYQK